MVYITNGKFVSDYINNQSNIEEILELFNAVLFALKKYSRNFLYNKILVDLKDEEFVTIVKLLKSVGKLNKSDIVKLINLIKENSTLSEKSFKIISNKGHDRVEEFLKGKFDKLKLEKVDSDKLGLSVSGEGYYYKRSLENDIEKLLK